MVFDRISKMFGGAEPEVEDSVNEFIEIDLEQEKSDSKIYVKTFVLKTYEDINGILAALREGYSIVVMDIRILKQKDVIELKRAISKVKKTVEALDGKIAGFGENTVIATPSRVFDIKKGDEVVAPKQPKDNYEMF
ncbi:MAG: SepF-like predicted cell division protein (DUF552 family) [Patescibacteria group bacterium]|jgi:SepF-like predicted cell division protein (DUF552 family)